MPGVPPTRFVYLGPEGTFAEQALRTLPGAQRGERTPVATIPEALDAVRGSDADAAMVPVESSVGGAVGVTLDELAEGDPLIITREVVLPISFTLAVRPGVDLQAVAAVAAHPQASTQCRRWLREHVPTATVVEALSNAAAAQAVADGRYDAALCTPASASRHRLVALAEQIADRPDAVTRFVLVGRPAAPLPATGDDVTSLAIYQAQDRPGGLLAVLNELASRGINLTRIESRPSGEGLGRYVFFIDCAGHVDQPRLGEALQGLRRGVFDVRFLGSYPRYRQPGAEPPRVFLPAGTSDADFADAAAWLDRVRAGRQY